MTMEVETSNHCFNILDQVEYDNSIESKQYVNYTPQSQFNLNDLGTPITIEINTGDKYILPSESYLYIRGQLVKANGNPYDNADEVALVNNAVMFLFSHIQYSIGNKFVETINHPGQVTSILSYLSQPDDYNTGSGLNMCWSKDTTIHPSSRKYNESPVTAADAAIAAGRFTPRENENYNQGFAIRKSQLMDSDPRGSFSFVIPLSHIFGFGDYNKVMYNLNHVLTLTRATSDNLAIFHAAGVDNGKVVLSNITWKVPKIEPETIKKMQLRSIIESKQSIPIAFTARTCESIVIPQNQEFSWRINASGVEKPRWIIVSFQTDKNNSQVQNPAVFDHLNLTNAYVSISGIKYPMIDFNSDFNKNDYSILYEMFDKFKREFYGFNSLVGGTQVNPSAFKKLFPIIVFDVRHQSETLKSDKVNVDLNFRFSVNVPANTTAYAITLSDRMYKLNSDGKNLIMVSS